MTSLNDLSIGEEGIIVEIADTHASANRLMSLGLLPGVRLKLIQHAPLGDPIAIEFSGQRISLRRTDAACIRLTPKPAPNATT